MPSFQPLTGPFLHREPDFADLVQLVAAERQLAPSLVEKDYWVTFCLSELIHEGWTVYFKGGTSLSKGYGIIERFSEDLDLKLIPPASAAAAAEINWRSQGSCAIEQRRSFFDRLHRALSITDCQVVEELRDEWQRSLHLRVEYPSTSGELPAPLRAGVLLEIGHARVTPSEPRPMDSWVMEQARASGVASYSAHKPVAVECVLPVVTLLEKLDAISRGYANLQRSAAGFVRHYEDAAAIVEYLQRENEWDQRRVAAVYHEMIESKDMRKLDFNVAALTLPPSERTAQLESAWAEAAVLHWGPRRSLREVVECIQGSVRPALNQA